MFIYLTRHGETDWNKEGRIQGQADNRLNAYGREAALRTGKALEHIPLDAAFCSPLIRAEETAKIMIGERKIPLYQDARLMEIGFGVREGAFISEIKRNPKDSCYNFFEHPDQYCPPKGGESFEELFARSKAFIQECIFPLENQYRAILIVDHGALNRSILDPLCGICLKDFWKEEMENCAVSRLLLEHGKLQVLERNRRYFD